VAGETRVSEILSTAEEENFLTIKIFNDQKPNDGITFGTASPRFIATIEVGNNAIDPVERFKFQIDNIDTLCDYITLAAPISLDSDEKFMPLANTSNVNPNDFKFENTATIPVNHIKNELLTYCLTEPKEGTFDADTGQVSNQCAGFDFGTGTAKQTLFNTLVMMPPFRTCSNTFANPSTLEDQSNFDTYVIKGSIGGVTGKVFDDIITNDGKRSLTIQMVADNVLLNQDEVKIVDSNNPFMTIYFIVDAGEPGAEILPFEISKVSTECTKVGFAANPQVN
jgi:hypothetical protein